MSAPPAPLAPTSAAASGSGGEAEAEQAAAVAGEQTVVSAAASASEEFPQWDPTTIGLPEGFILYGYNTLKG